MTIVIREILLPINIDYQLAITVIQNENSQKDMFNINKNAQKLLQSPGANLFIFRSLVGNINKS